MSGDHPKLESDGRFFSRRMPSWLWTRVTLAGAAASAAGSAHCAAPLPTLLHHRRLDSAEPRPGCASAEPRPWRRLFSHARSTRRAAARAAFSLSDSFLRGSFRASSARAASTSAAFAAFSAAARRCCSAAWLCRNLVTWQVCGP